MGGESPGSEKVSGFWGIWGESLPE